MLTALTILLGLAVVALYCGVVGAQAVPTAGTPASTRYDKTAAQVVTIAHGKYTEAVQAGNCFSACHAAGDAPGTTISTTAMLCLHNPSGSNRRIAVLKVWIAYVSGTIGTGTMFHTGVISGSAALPTGTASTSGTINNDLGNTGTGVGVPLWTATVTAPKVLAPFMTLNPILASSVLTPVLTFEDMDGIFYIEPGCNYQLQSIAAAGTSPLFASGIAWEEVPLV